MRVTTFVRQDEIDGSMHFIRTLTLFFCAFFASRVTDGATDAADGASEAVNNVSVPCEIYKSSEAPAEWGTAVQVSLMALTGLSCQIEDSTLAEPFEKSSRSNHPNVVFQFWIQRIERSNEMIVRAFEPGSSLQWGMMRARLESLSPESIQLILADSLHRMLKVFPFVGVYNSQGLVFWGSQKAPQLKLWRRLLDERHPFIPSVLSFKMEPASKQSFQIVDRGAGSFSLKPPPTFKGSERLWLAISK